MGNDRAGKDGVNRRVVLVTGASSGIGLACVRRLAGLGHAVFGASRRPGPDGIGVEFLAMDVDEEISVRSGLTRVLDREGRIDAVVNCAGFGLAGAVEDISIEEARAQFETNFFGTVRVCRAVLPVMRGQGSGIIVNVSSLAGLAAIPFQAYYSASKFALEGLTEALDMEVRPYGVRVVLVEPGDFRTGFTANRRRAASGRGSVYEERFAAALTVMEKDELGGPEPEAVAALIGRLLEKPNPRLRYTAGRFAQRAGVALKRFLPAALFRRWLMKYYGL